MSGENKLREAWLAACRRDPCDWCGSVHPEFHHADCVGQNICHDCYLEDRELPWDERRSSCMQCYPGDEGYSFR